MALPLYVKGERKGFLGMDDPKVNKENYFYLEELSYFIENDHFVAHLNLDIQIPVSCNYEKSGISLTLNHSNAILTCPLENGHLKHYLKDYKNYYYLPMEDLVIHKSMKSFVDTTSIIRADKNNCYSKFTPGDSFLSAKTDVTNYCADIIYYILSEK